MSLNSSTYHTLTLLPHDDKTNRFVRIGGIPNSHCVFECGTVTDGEVKINASINADGTCSFVNSELVSFLTLADVPHSYEKKVGHVLVVGEDENSLKFSDEIKVKTLKADILTSGDVLAKNLTVDGDLNCSKIHQKTHEPNVFLGPLKCDAVSATDVDVKALKSESVTGKDLVVENIADIGKVVCKELNVKGLSEIDELKATAIYNNLLECDGPLKASSAEILNDFNVHGKSIQKEIESHSVKNSADIETHSLHSKFAEIKHLSVDFLTAEKVISASHLCFGTVDEPLVSHDENITFDLDHHLRGHGYGFCPTQLSDTLNFKITGKDFDLTKHSVKAHFHYYNTKQTTPLIYHIGTNIYQVKDDIMCHLKFSGTFPIAPYWCISIELVPF